jgi:putative transcriptional regulator
LPLRMLRRFFCKYAGWGPGQLESECRRGVWFTVAAAPSVIVSPPSDSDGGDAWHAVLQLMGGDYAQLSDNVRAAEARKRTTASGGSSGGGGGAGQQQQQRSQPPSVGGTEGGDLPLL